MMRHVEQVSASMNDGIDEMKVAMRRQDGFTLVELMVAVALLGVVMTIVFALFSTTSNALYEADSLANTLDRTRFAVEQISSGIRSGGSFGSPDSNKDPWVKPDRGGDIRMIGVSSYNGWQNDTTLLNNANLIDAHDSNQDNVADVSFDGIIVMGGIDFPQSFEITDLKFVSTSGDTAGRVNGAVIPDNERGVYKLIINDPFYTRTGLPPGIKLGSGTEDLILNDMHNRLIRVMDRNGYMQISGIEGQSSGGGTGPSYTKDTGISFDLQTPMLVRNNTSDASGAADDEFGLERESDDDEDIGYDAALIDAYWYHVEPVPDDPGNFRLVRERLDAQALATALATGPNTVTAATLADAQAAKDASGSKDREKVVITDRVVDFQIWFDCADNDGNVVNAAWQMAWANPGGGACMNPGADQFERARMAHVRLSVRTENERKELPDEAEALRMDDTGKVGANVPLRYFNVYPNAEGSARVVTVQTDIELTNYATRNLANPVAAP